MSDENQKTYDIIVVGACEQTLFGDEDIAPQSPVVVQLLCIRTGLNEKLRLHRRGCARESCQVRGVHEINLLHSAEHCRLRRPRIPRSGRSRASTPPAVPSRHGA